MMRLFRKHKPSPTHNHYVNWWKAENPDSWLERFCRFRSIQPLTFASVFGQRETIKKKGPLVFFSCENLQDRFTEYSDHLEGIADLRLGFEHRHESDYLRLPLWLIYFTEPESKNPGEQFENLLNRKWLGPRPISCSLIARHDDRGNGAGLRRLAGETIQTVTEVQFAGAFNNNTNSLKRKYDNHTNYYLRDCHFNICLENSNGPGYVTEKIWRPMLNGAIPIYWGSDMQPEPEVLASSSFIPFDPNNPQHASNNVAELLRSRKLIEDFVNQPKTTSTCCDWIDHRLNLLERSLKAL
jgi:hypothetical protein